jgi:hypothetical protein
VNFENGVNLLGSGNQVRVRLAGDQGRDWQDDEGNKCRRWSRRISAIVTCKVTPRHTADVDMKN